MEAIMQLSQRNQGRAVAEERVPGAGVTGKREHARASPDAAGEPNRGLRPPLRIVVKNPALTVGWRNDKPAARIVDKGHLAGLGFLILMFVLSVVYVAMGGVLAG
jgi:hypothetical protein